MPKKQNSSKASTLAAKMLSGSKKPRIKDMPKKQSSSKVSTLAAKVLSGSKKPTTTDAKKLAASVLSQDETKGQSRKK